MNKMDKYKEEADGIRQIRNSLRYLASDLEDKEVSVASMLWMAGVMTFACDDGYNYTISRTKRNDRSLLDEDEETEEEDENE